LASVCQKLRLHLLTDVGFTFLFHKRKRITLQDALGARTALPEWSGVVSIHFRRAVLVRGL